jgi:hypothetical protein
VLSNTSIEEVFNMDYYTRKVMAYKDIREWIDDNIKAKDVNYDYIVGLMMSRYGFSEKFVNKYLQTLHLSLLGGKLVKI